VQEWCEDRQASTAEALGGLLTELEKNEQRKSQQAIALPGRRHLLLGYVVRTTDESQMRPFFSRDLLDLESQLVDYVIVHEPLYLRLPNHGRLWKSFMRAHLGDYEGLHRRLPRRAVLSGAPDDVWWAVPKSRR
jgi:hypothetical protein